MHLSSVRVNLPLILSCLFSCLLSFRQSWDSCKMSRHSINPFAITRRSGRVKLYSFKMIKSNSRWLVSVLVQLLLCEPWIHCPLSNNYSSVDNLAFTISAKTEFTIGVRAKFFFLTMKKSLSMRIYLGLASYFGWCRMLSTLAIVYSMYRGHKVFSPPQSFKTAC